MTPTVLTFGPWHLDRDRLTLDLIIDGRVEYEVDLERCSTAAAVLDWIVQVTQKGWATHEIVAHLVDALSALLDPQARLCGQGISDAPDDPSIANVILENEIRTRAGRLAAARLVAIVGERTEPGALRTFSAAEWTAAEHRATVETRRELGLPGLDEEAR